jgi:hypothetical protein
MSVIGLCAKRSLGLFPWYPCKPRFSIDGCPEQICAWGDNTILVSPGRHHLRVWCASTARSSSFPTTLDRELNVADIRIDVPEAQTLRVVYMTAWHRHLVGKLDVVGTSDIGTPPAAAAPAPYAVAAPPASPAPRPGWHPDPAGRHGHRWWDGQQWTPTVADQDTRSYDPL